MTPRTRMIIVNSPHNPTATVLVPSTTSRRLAALTRNTEIVDPVRRGLRAHRVRRRGPPEHGALSGARRTQRHRLLVRQDLSRHRLAGRLLPGAGGAHEGDPQGAPVPDVCGRYADAARLLRDARGSAELSSVGAFYQKKRDLLASKLAGSRCGCCRARARFFMLASFRHLTTSRTRLCVRLISDHRVATIPCPPSTAIAKTLD